MPESYDWTRFRVHIYVSRPPEEVYRRWASAAGMESFFLAKAEFRAAEDRLRKPEEVVAAGDTYYWKFLHNYELSGAIIESVGDNYVVFTFGSMEVKVSVHAVESGSLVRLDQYNIPSDTEMNKASSHLNCRSCWAFYMTNLKSVCETGYDLRDRDPARSDCISVDFTPRELS